MIETTRLKAINLIIDETNNRRLEAKNKKFWYSNHDYKVYLEGKGTLHLTIEVYDKHDELLLKRVLPSCQTVKKWKEQLKEFLEKVIDEPDRSSADYKAARKYIRIY